MSSKQKERKNLLIEISECSSCINGYRKITLDRKGGFTKHVVPCTSCSGTGKKYKVLSGDYKQGLISDKELTEILEKYNVQWERS